MSIAGYGLSVWGLYVAALIGTETGGIDDLGESYRMETHVLDDDGYPGYFRCCIFTMNIHRKCLPSWKWGTQRALRKD